MLQNMSDFNINDRIYPNYDNPHQFYHGHITCITGKAGSGKTNYILSMIDKLENKNEEVVILFTDQDMLSIKRTLAYINQIESETIFLYSKYYENSSNVLTIQNRRGVKIKLVFSDNFHDCLNSFEGINGFFKSTIIIDGFNNVNKNSIINYEKYKIIKRQLLIEKVSKSNKNYKNIIQYSSQYGEMKQVTEVLSLFSKIHKSKIIITANAYSTPNGEFIEINSSMMYESSLIVGLEKNPMTRKTEIGIIKSRY